MTDPILIKNTFGEELYRFPASVLVLVPDEWENIGSPEQQLLSKILGSVRLSLAAVRILTVGSFSIDEVMASNARTILSFGVPVAGLSTFYEARVLEDVTVIMADRINELDDARKKDLWSSLKQVFSL